jgi:hypothetical protein
MLVQQVNLGDINIGGPGYVDLAVLWNKLSSEYNITFPYEG